MKFKVLYKVNGSYFPAYYQTESNAFEDMTRKLKHGYVVHIVERLSW